MSHWPIGSDSLAVRSEERGSINKDIAEITDIQFVSYTVPSLRRPLHSQYKQLVLLLYKIEFTETNAVFTERSPSGVQPSNCCRYFNTFDELLKKYSIRGEYMRTVSGSGMPVAV